MKKIITTLILLLTLSVVGGLCNSLAQLNKLEATPTTLADAHSFPYELPDVIMQPFPMVPLY